MEKIFKYPIVAREDGDFWIIFIPDFYEQFGGMTQAESGRAISKMATGYIKLAIKELIESGEEIPKPSFLKDLDMSKYENFKFDNATDYMMYVRVNLPELKDLQRACSQVSELDVIVHDEIAKSIETGKE